MPPHGPAPTPDTFRQLTETALKISIDDDVALIQELVAEHLRTGPKVTARELIPHIAEHFQYVFPAVMSDQRAAGAFKRLAAAWEANRPRYEVDYLAAHPATPVASGVPSAGTPYGDQGVDFPWSKAALGAAATAIGGYYALQALVAYCGDVHPPKGESAPVHC